MTLTQTLVLILLAAVITMLARIGVTVYKILKEFPVEARLKNLKLRYPDLFTELDAAIGKASNASELMRALKSISYPTETLFVATKKENISADDQATDGKSEIINRLKPRIEHGMNHTNNIIINGGGYGRKNDQHYYIARQKIEKFGIEHIEIKLERVLPVMVFA